MQYIYLDDFHPNYRNQYLVAINPLQLVYRQFQQSFHVKICLDREKYQARYCGNCLVFIYGFFRKATNRKIFPHDNLALKAVWLAIQSASKRLGLS